MDVWIVLTCKQELFHQVTPAGPSQYNKKNYLPVIKKSKCNSDNVLSRGYLVLQFNTVEDEDIDMETVHDSQAFIHHHLNLLERPSTPGKYIHSPQF